MEIAAKTLSILGLILSLRGSWLIWKFGLPASIDRNGYIYDINEGRDQEQIEEGRKYDARSTFGFKLMGLGFILQTLGTLLAP